MFIPKFTSGWFIKLEYRAAKIVIKTRMNIPKAALLLELGWEPIIDFINRQKVSYYKRLLELPDDRLYKSVFNEMVRKGDSFWNYKEHVSSLSSSSPLLHKRHLLCALRCILNRYF
jgi:succinate dehydrogenase flavin-adding protein (antitoxin of CptAB toxin-antitoxin module)